MYMMIFAIKGVILKTDSYPYSLSLSLCMLGKGVSNLGERSGLVVECLIRDRGAPGSCLTGVTAAWSLSKTHLS